MQCLTLNIQINHIDDNKDNNYYTNSNAVKSTIELAEGGAYGSNGALKLTQNDDKGVGLYRDFTFEAGKTYTISAYIKAGENTTIPEAGSTAGKQIAIKIVGESTTQQAMGMTITNNWQRISYEYTPAESGVQTVQINPIRDGARISNGLYTEGASLEFYYDDVCITENLPEASTEETTGEEKKTYIKDSFDTNITTLDWTQKSGATLSYDGETTGPDGKAGVMKLVQTKTVGACLDMTFEQGKIYELSVWAKADTESLANIKGTTNFNFYFDEDGSGAGTVVNHRVTSANGGGVSDSWKQFTYMYKHTQPTITVTTRLYVESTSGQSVSMYFDDFVAREVGVDLEDNFENNQGVWSMSNAASTVTTTSETAKNGQRALKVSTVKDNHMAIMKNIAFEAGKTYEISTWIKSNEDIQLDYPAVVIRNYSYEKTVSGKHDSYTETDLGTKKLKADEDFGANANWQKFTLLYTPETVENYAYSDIRFIADNVKWANAAENEFTYFLDDVRIKEVKTDVIGGATIVNGKISYTVENLSGKGYHVMQSTDGVNYVSVKSGFAGSTIGYEGISGADYYITVIDTLAGAAVSTQTVEVNPAEPKEFNLEFDSEITRNELSTGILVKASNDTEEDKSFTVVVADYAENGELLSCSFTPISALSGYNSVRSVSYNGGANTVKMMFINLQTMQYVKNAVIVE